jgi:hypothetical protein
VTPPAAFDQESDSAIGEQGNRVVTPCPSDSGATSMARGTARLRWWVGPDRNPWLGSLNAN